MEPPDVGQLERSNDRARRRIAQDQPRQRAIGCIP
jgi:hypothetical protein